MPPTIRAESESAGTMQSADVSETEDAKLARMKTKIADSLRGLIQKCPPNSELSPLRRKLEHFAPLSESNTVDNINMLRILLTQLSQETQELTKIDMNQAQWDAAAPEPKRLARVAPHHYKHDVSSTIKELLEECS